MVTALAALTTGLGGAVAQVNAQDSAQAVPAAQDVPGAQDNPQRLLEEIVVTARRQSENLQDVPVAISTFSSTALEREQINTLQDLRGRVPSLIIGGSGQQRNSESPTVRGQGGSFGASPGVVLYYGEVPLPADFPFNGQGGPGAFFDLSNVQVLKGPQGTLFGRNTTGGALLLDPAEPTEEFSGSITAQGSSYNGQDYEGVLNLPLIKDTLLTRASFMSNERDGFTKDLSNGNKLDDQDYWTGRLGVTWRPTERIENYTLGYYTNSKNNGTGLVIEDFNQQGLNTGLPLTIASAAGIPVSAIPALAPILAGVFGVPPSTFTDIDNFGCNLLNAKTGSTNCGQDIVAAQKDRGIRRIETSLTPNDKIETGAVIDQFSYEVNDAMKVRNIASYTTFQHSFNWDADGSVAQMQDLATPKSIKAYDVSQSTEELQLQGTALDERLEYVVGGYYQKIEPEGTQGQMITAFFLPQPLEHYEITTESYAPYAQATYDLGNVIHALDGVKFTGGLRYTTDNIDGFSEAGSRPHSEKLSYEETTYTAGLDYQFDNTLVYGKFSRGYKAGGFSTTAVTPENYTYKPEYVDSFEIGQKSDLAIGKVPARLNTSAYYTNYDDMQRSGIDAAGTSIGSALFTAGKASIYGAELEAMVEPLDGLKLSANYSYMHAQYDEYNLRYQGVLPIVDCTGKQIGQGDIQKLDCAPFQNAPDNQFSVTASYDLPLNSAYGLVNASLTYGWTDKLYLSPYSLPATEPGAWLDSQGLLNGSISWNNVMGSHFDLMLFGTNLTDEEYRISNSNVWNLVYYRASIYGEPRILGARLTYRWGG
jgi:iron complex outermembrane receptor protein